MRTEDFPGAIEKYTKYEMTIHDLLQNQILSFVGPLNLTVAIKYSTATELPHTAK